MRLDQGWTESVGHSRWTKRVDGVGWPGFDGLKRQLFAELIKTEARFFSRTAAVHLGVLFDRIDEMRTADGQSLFQDAGPETAITHLCRGRVF